MSQRFKPYRLFESDKYEIDLVNKHAAPKSDFASLTYSYAQLDGLGKFIKCISK